MDPVEAADKDRDAAIKERDDAQRAWQEMGMKHERAMETNLKLQADFSKAFKDLPWLEQRNSELAEHNILQHNEIERLEVFKQKHDELLQQISAYGMSAKRPEYHQQRSENLQRELEISNNLLGKSEKYVKALKEELGSQREKANKEKDWLRAQLKKNARSTAYWAKYRTNDGALESKPAWGIRCACTEPEIAHSLKDQSPRIVELEATVAARDLTITHLRETRAVGVHKNGTALTSNAVKASLPLTEDTNSDTIAGSQLATTTRVHTSEHQEQCTTHGKQLADDAKTIKKTHALSAKQHFRVVKRQKNHMSKQLLKECQYWKNLASNNTTANAAETNAKANFEGELAAKDTVIKDLREELAARNETIDDHQKKESTASEELATRNQEIKDLRKEKMTADEELAAKNKEIDKLREEKTAADENSKTEISNIGQELSESRKDLVDAREGRAECERELKQQRTRINELETAQHGLENAIEQKDREIVDLEEANQELAEQPVQDPRRLTTANTNLDELRHQLESQIARVSELEAAGRELGATINVKDGRIAKLEEQINNAPSRDLIERQNQSHDEAISKKDRDYQALYDLYAKLLIQQKSAEAQHNEDMQSLNTIQQSDSAKQMELQRLWTENNNLRLHHANCDERSTDLANQLRQGANTYTDLQIKYNTQATDLDEANQNARGLRSQIANLQQAITGLEETHSSSESNIDQSALQAHFDREMSAQALKLEASEVRAFKLENQLRQLKNQANPLREMQIKVREDAIKAKEDALNLNTDAMDHDQQGSKVEQEIKDLEGKLAAANREAGDAKARSRGTQTKLTKEKKERAEEKSRHEKELKKEQEDAKSSLNILRLRLERDNPLKATVSKLQNEVTRLSKALEERKA